MNSKNDKIIVLDNNTAYLAVTQAAVTFSSSGMFAEPDAKPILVRVPGGKNYRGAVPWGAENDLPSQITAKVGKSPVLSSGMLFNITLGYGCGIVAGKWSNSEGKDVFTPVLDNAEINTFFEENDIQGYLLEQLTDMNFFYNVFPEIILNREKSPRIVQLSSKEASFSRWEEMSSKGIIENHFYSAYWNSSTKRADPVPTPVLSPYNPVRDLRVRMGLEKNDKGVLLAPKDYRFIIPLNFPTPGKSYYQKPYWYSVIESGWYDYAQKIPAFKNALMDNQMTIKYHVELSDDYFDKIFQAEGITRDEEKKARILKEYTDLNAFLTSTKNAGKSVISFVRYTPDGKELRRMKINVIENTFKGGEYIEDSEEASNILSYGIGVHPSLIGSSPGKSKTINGTEARELFIIKQAMLRPLRDRLLMPLYLVKNFNGWDPSISFDIPNMTLTTLDRGTGSEKVIS
jgi:hypothetical protein